MFIYYVILWLLKIILYLFLTFVFLVVVARVCLEPVKGVCKCKTNFLGKIALVTGGNSGLGLETARDLARRGARVIIACRDEKKAREAIEDITHTTGNSDIQFLYLNLFKPSSIREFAENFNNNFDRLDILVNNAGCAGSPPKLAENGVEMTMQVNYVGPFLLTKLLINKLGASKPSRIIIVSSKSYYIAKLRIDDLAGVNLKSHLMKYADSKLCNILWTKALAKRLPEGVTVNSLHPGFVRTDIFKRLGYFRRTCEITAELLFKTAQEGAQTIIHLCVSPELENQSGGYYTECKLRDCSKLAQDGELEQRLWEESIRLSEK